MAASNRFYEKLALLELDSQYKSAVESQTDQLGELMKDELGDKWDRTSFNLPLNALQEPVLLRRVAALELFYKKWRTWGWKPVFGYYIVDGLPFSTWDLLLKSRGLASELQDGLGGLSDVAKKSDEEPRATVMWDAYIMNGTDVPIFNGVSPDGQYGKNAPAALAALAKLPRAPENAKPKDLIAHFSPSKDMYLSMHYAIARANELYIGVDTIDRDSYTITNEQLVVNATKQLRTLVFRYDALPDQVKHEVSPYDKLNWTSTGSIQSGVRPALRGIDLVRPVLA